MSVKQNTPFNGYCIIREDTGCWEWLGALSPDGYGVYNNSGRNVYAHRFSYTRTKGSIPDGLELYHTCKNRKCANPEHLEAVTHTVNAQRSAGVKMCPDSVRELREYFKLPGSTYMSTAIKFKISESQAKKIVNRIQWRNVK